ncbi:MAG: S-adenosylmethionine:tRNA ribosyltransferase-isomerase [Bacteroidia bacterium]|nr:MAG: S-adenosylmethionine:tRNA ribosyltransferase-isomerase [Bacteroidia bacterium]
MNNDPGNIRIDDYTYDLPVDRIAKYPLPVRDTSKLLIWRKSEIKDSHFRQLPEIIDRDTLLVFNNTRVIRARLIFVKDSGAVIEIFCLEPLEPHDFAGNLSAGPGVEWKCLIGNLKRWKKGPLSTRFHAAGNDHMLQATRLLDEGDAFRIRFDWDESNITFGEILETTGHVPIPPYLGRDDDESDRSRYQTMYARVEGSVAAPTAGLHFTPETLELLDKAGIERAEVTLHVSAGTFRPVKSEKIADHKMHTEHFFISAETVSKLKHNNILAVGTTTVRTLESIYWLGSAIAAGREPSGEVPSVSQWEPYENESLISREEALDSLLNWITGRSEAQAEVEVRTDIIIVPGYRFRMVTAMLTNFHQPGSTLLLLVAAFTGKEWKEIYSHALNAGYRFLSYGDSMLLMP